VEKPSEHTYSSDILPEALYDTEYRDYISLPVTTGKRLLFPAIGRSVLPNVFTSSPINIDGIAEPAWDATGPSPIGISMTGNLSAEAPECTTFGEVRSLWDGALLYLFIDVNDKDITTAGQRPANKDGIEVYFDLYNDKFPKYEEDDGIIRVSANAAEGDCISAEAAKPVFRFLGAVKKLALNLRRTDLSNPSGAGPGHRLDNKQTENLLHFCNYIFYDTPLPEELKTELYDNPYLSTMEEYYGGKRSMMPWLNSVHFNEK
jgi:hypothetical protein